MVIARSPLSISRRRIETKGAWKVPVTPGPDTVWLSDLTCSLQAILHGVKVTEEERVVL